MLKSSPVDKIIIEGDNNALDIASALSHLPEVILTQHFLLKGIETSSSGTVKISDDQAASGSVIDSSRRISFVLML